MNVNSPSEVWVDENLEGKGTFSIKMLIATNKETNIYIGNKLKVYIRVIQLKSNAKKNRRSAGSATRSQVCPDVSAKKKSKPLMLFNVIKHMRGKIASLCSKITIF